MSSDRHDLQAEATEDLHVHVTPISVLLGVFGLLLFFTVITVAATYVDLGDLNIWIALMIAVIKAAVVALYFMHLKYDRPFHGVILVASILLVALFIGLSLMDTGAYQENISRTPATREGE